MKMAKVFLGVVLLLVLAACSLRTQGSRRPSGSPELPPDPPELYGEELAAEYAHVVYIIDVSCSMDSQWQTFTDEYGNNASGYRMDRAKAEVIGSIFELDETNRFDVVAYLSDGVEGNFLETKEATPEHKEQAVSWVRTLSAKGATETGMGPAVAWALENPGYSDVMDYILVTGGAPVCIEDPAAHLQAQMVLIQEANGKGAAVHVVLVTPNCEEAYDFGEAVVAETGGRLVILE